jgi:hypothetical protein
MLQAILRFCSLEETLVVDAMAALARRRANRMDMEERTKVSNQTLAETRIFLKFFLIFLLFVLFLVV